MKLSNLCSCFAKKEDLEDGSLVNHPSPQPQPKPSSGITPPFATILVTMGPCGFSVGMMKCTCPGGTAMSGPGQDGSTLLCSLCEHLMSDHSNYSPPNAQSASLSHSYQPTLSGQQSNFVDGNPEICPRTETVRGLAHIVDEFRVAHVRGTPSSGKTTLAHLLRSYYLALGEQVIIVTAWHEVDDPIQHLVRVAGKQGYHGLNYDSFRNSNLIIIFDEAQHSYGDLELWIGLIKTQSGMRFGPRLCLFSSYGSPTTGPADYPLGTTPVHFGPKQRVSITVSRHTNDHPHLFYTRLEFADVVDRLCSDPRRPLALDEEAKEYIFEITNGHPAAIQGLVEFIISIYRSAIKHHGIGCVTKDLLIHALDDDAKVFEALQAYPVSRSFPAKGKLTVEAADALRDILRYGSIPRDLDNPGIRHCYEQGWIHSEPLDSWGEDVVCVLPSRLHEKYVEYYLGSKTPKPFPITTYPSLPAFCEALLRRFSRSRLCTSAQGRIGAAAQIRPPEAQFQDEIYSTFDSLLGRGHPISSEWSRTGTGRIDFRIVEPAWGIELLRDGDRLTEHCNRFVSNGAYHQWIVDGWIKDWIILDIRHSIPQKYKISGVPGTKLWRVVFGDDYMSAKVLGCDNEIVISEFPLMN